jgi:predicted nucleic acid-binding Zn ribbon protein
MPPGARHPGSRPTPASSSRPVYREPRPIADALARVTERAAPATTLARIQGSWEAVAGAVVAAEAEPVSEREGVVTVACRSAVWAGELELLSPGLVEGLNEALGAPAVVSLRFVVGRRERPR